MAAQDDFDMLASLAERFQLDEEESENFVTSGMRRLGHKARQMWEDGDGNDGGGGGDFFSRKGGSRERRSTTPERRRSNSGGNWQYGR